MPRFSSVLLTLLLSLICVLIVAQILLIAYGFILGFLKPDLDLWVRDATYSVRTDAVLFDVVLVDDQKTETFMVPANSIAVKVRDDGASYTSVKLQGRSAANACKSAILLVPNEEDYNQWQDWLEKIKQFRLEYLENLKSPKRVVPHGNDAI